MKQFTDGYKNRYEVYAHLRTEPKLESRTEIYSEYVYDTCLVFAREQFRNKHPQYIIDTIRLSQY